jgi:uncharacterized membrane protein
MAERTTQYETYEEIPSRAAILGHPIHPMIIPFPIAFLVGTLITDLIFLSSRDPFWAQASLWLVGAGVLSGVAAAVFGMIDFWTIDRVREFRAAWGHFLGNAVVIVLAIINALQRIDDPALSVEPWGVLLSGIAAFILIITGWLGGELSYRHKVGVNSAPPHL